MSEDTDLVKTRCLDCGRTFMKDRLHMPYKWRSTCPECWKKRSEAEKNA